MDATYIPSKLPVPREFVTSYRITGYWLRSSCPNFYICVLLGKMRGKNRNKTGLARLEQNIVIIGIELMTSCVYLNIQISFLNMSFLLEELLMYTKVGIKTIKQLEVYAITSCR